MAQLWHLPFKNNQLKTGILSTILNWVLHFGQVERGMLRLNFPSGAGILY
ncbi:hypothetical protein VCR29J2_450188 [Vibrio coralliirubri]|nr:hypothetical protein VCR29J2_450188 [Vibrio coralliirubri]